MQENIILPGQTREGTKFLSLLTAPCRWCSRQWSFIKGRIRHVQKSIYVETADVVFCRALQSEISQNAANQGAEFKTMTGTAGREHDMWEFRVFINYEIFIGCDRIQAYPR